MDAGKFYGSISGDATEGFRQEKDNEDERQGTEDYEEPEDCLEAEKLSDDSSQDGTERLAAHADCALSVWNMFF